MDKSSLGTRMKGYEGVSRNFLTRRMPVIIRLDGKAFHTFTRGMKRPFDEILTGTMQATMKYLCENIQGCVLGYTQSDEITLVLVDYKTIDTYAWFDNNVQKMVSISASMATFAFNKAFENAIYDYCDNTLDYVSDLFHVYCNASDKGALFDSRVFNITKEEVCNCLIWRQQDATRNSIQSVGQANFTEKELHKKSCNMIQDMLITEKGINWNDIPTHLKRGSCCIKETIQNPNVDIKDGVCIRNQWIVDEEIPIFTQDRNYIEKLVMV
jgi:tRNA(His) 5'-end guanylyltransferase